MGKEEGANREDAWEIRKKEIEHKTGMVMSIFSAFQKKLKSAISLSLFMHK